MPRTVNRNTRINIPHIRRPETFARSVEEWGNEVDAAIDELSERYGVLFSRTDIGLFEEDGLWHALTPKGRAPLLPAMARGVRSTAKAITTATDTIIDCDDIYGSDGSNIYRWDTTAQHVVAPFDGFFRLTGQVIWQSGFGVGNTSRLIASVDTTDVELDRRTGLDQPSASGSIILPAEYGEPMRFKVRHDAGANRSIAVFRGTVEFVQLL